MLLVGACCAEQDHELALYLVLTFVLYLRPGEALTLTPDQLVAPQLVASWARQSWGVILGPLAGGTPTKVGEFDQSVLLDRDDLHLEPLLEKLLAAARFGSSQDPKPSIGFSSGADASN